MVEITIPRVYEFKEGETPEKFKKYEGWNKISHSQVESFKNSMYRGNYLAHYFAGGPRDYNIFSDFGTMCGEYIASHGVQKADYLDEDDINVLNSLIATEPKDSEYEREIVIDLEPLGLKKTVMQGFIDRYSPGTGLLTDFKTGNTSKKQTYYGSEEYRQLDIYSYALRQEGCNVKETNVTLLGRKGNQLDKAALHSNGKTNMGLRLSGEIIIIPREYDEEFVEQSLLDVVKVCKKISEYYKVYKKYLC